MKTLDISFTKSKKNFPVGSWAIRWWTAKGLFKMLGYSHVVRAVEIRDWGKRYFQASEGSVNYEYEKYFLAKHKIVESYTIEISKDLDSRIKKECYQEAGNSYATMQNLGMVYIDLMFRLFGKKRKNPWTKGRNCSEIIYTAVFKQMFADLEYNENNIKPHEIKEIILNKFKLDSDGIWRAR